MNASSNAQAAQQLSEPGTQFGNIGKSSMERRPVRGKHMDYLVDIEIHKITNATFPIYQQRLEKLCRSCEGNCMPHLRGGSGPRQQPNKGIGQTLIIRRMR